MAFAVVKGYKVRISKVDSCGLPLQGPGNRFVTDGFIRVNLDPEIKAAEDIEVLNAEGKVCVKDRTPPERKWWNVSIDWCRVDPELHSLLTGWPQELDYDDNVIGMRDQSRVASDSGVMVELWTGGESDDDCLPPTDDSIFSATTTGRQYGYFRFAAKEWQTGALTVEAGAATFTTTAMTMEAPHWGRGPYNVAAINSNGDAGRLLTAVGDDEHLQIFRTPIAPPEATNGACELAIQSIFTGGPGLAYFGADAADVAPHQPICNGTSYEVEITGTGNVKLKVGVEETADIAHTALPAAVKSAIEALSNVAPGQVEVTGAAGDYVVKLDASLPALSGVDGTADVTVTAL